MLRSHVEMLAWLALCFPSEIRSTPRHQKGNIQKLEFKVDHIEWRHQKSKQRITSCIPDTFNNKPRQMIRVLQTARSLDFSTEVCFPVAPNEITAVVVSFPKHHLRHALVIHTIQLYDLYGRVVFHCLE